MGERNPFLIAQQQVKAAVDALGGSTELYHLLKAPARIVEVVSLPSPNDTVCER
jgi:hypothetical protein